jgi:NAD(P)-dependent dehydrogenase (short-subunit alcohol dehydrogenase family)
MLNGKIAVIYGAGGAIGAATARVFAREGAKVFLTGRRQATLRPVAEAIQKAGGFADVAEVDALDERAVDAHLARVVEQNGQIDVSFNAVGFPNAAILGVPLVDLELERLTAPLLDYTASFFLTARLAARRMLPRRSGVIMSVTALHARMGLPVVGGYGLAMAAKEALTRQLSVELAPHGIRVLGLRPYAMPETPTIRNAYEPRAKTSGLSWEQWQEMLAGRTHARRLMKLDELTELAAFLASDRGSGMTGTTVNLTLGSVDD